MQKHGKLIKCVGVRAPTLPSLLHGLLCQQIINVNKAVPKVIMLQWKEQLQESNCSLMVLLELHNDSLCTYYLIPSSLSLF